MLTRASIERRTVRWLFATFNAIDAGDAAAARIAARVYTHWSNVLRRMAIQGLLTHGKPKLTNAQFAALNEEFRNACGQAGIPPTKRQAGKYRRATGAAFAAR